MKKLLFIAALAMLSGCVTQPWTKEDQAKFEQEQGLQTCPAFFSCYSLRDQEKLNTVFLDKD